MNLSQMIALAALAFGAWQYVGHSGDGARLSAAGAMLGVQQTTIDAKNRELESAIAISEANRKAFEAEKAERTRIERIAFDQKVAATKRAADLQTALKRIHNAPKSFDGPIAPVLRHELDDLRADGVRPVPDAGDAAPNGADPSPTGAPADRPSEPAVQPAPPTS